MAVPKFHEFMLPVLKVLSDGREYTVGEMKDKVISDLKLSMNDLAELLPSGRKTRVNDRIEWARTYLKMAGLVSMPRRGMTTITEEGKRVLADAPAAITIAYLQKYPEFQQFRNGVILSAGELPTDQTVDVLQNSTPEEVIEKNINELTQVLAEEIIDRLKAIEPASFEQLVIDLLAKMGYAGASGSASVVGRTGDGGIDGVINEDRLGLSKIYVQAKRWEANVGDVEIGRFVGALVSKGASKGVFITTSSYTKQARETVATNRSPAEVVLVDGKQLANLMIEYGLGVSTATTYSIKRIDSDFFA